MFFCKDCSLVKQSYLSIIFALVFISQFKNSLSEPGSKAPEPNTSNREGRIMPVFQVVRFQNDACSGTSYNGTCYTKSECNTKGGTSDGTCASGFGVCCTFSLGCGESASENNTYMVQAATTSFTTNPCVIKLCPVSSSICRIRYDLSTFVLASQTTATNAAEATAAPSVAAGHCLTDVFTITSPGGYGSPPICGTNSGYHMILDSDGTSCQNANFAIGTSTTSTRQWNVRVTQFTCAQQDEAGPPGCLQYYTQTANTIENYAFPTGFTASTSTGLTTITHLADQHYDICIRRASGYCYICYSALKSSDPISFGLSISVANPTAASSVENALLDSSCQTDYIEIPQGELAPTAAIVTQAALGPALFATRFCGRVINVISATGTIADVTICSKQKPFRVGVNFDTTEVCSGTNTSECEYDVSATTMTGGIQGFKLIYWQNSC